VRTDESCHTRLGGFADEDFSVSTLAEDFLGEEE